MTATLEMESPEQKIQDSIGVKNWRDSVAQACRSIAPNWPLDRMIAVNPWWTMRKEPVREVSSRLAALGGVRMLMPMSHYAKQWHVSLHEGHLQRSRNLTKSKLSREQLINQLRQESSIDVWPSIADLMDQNRDRQHRMSWMDEMTFQISQTCGAVFQKGGQLEENGGKRSGLYLLWLDSLKMDRGIEVLMGEPGLRDQFAQLPSDHMRLIQMALEEFKIPTNLVKDLCHGWLLEIGGWASWVAYLEFSESQKGHEVRLVEELLAIRMAWDLALWRHAKESGFMGQVLERLWSEQLTKLPAEMDRQKKLQEAAWVWQTANEQAYQDQLFTLLRQPPAFNPKPKLQAAFCIDVRSEPLRRALESQDPGIQTFGFAGFFGLPIEYRPLAGKLSRPQCPGPFTPTIIAQEQNLDRQSSHVVSEKLRKKVHWKSVLSSAPSMFSMVETAGLNMAWKLVKDVFGSAQDHHPVDHMHGSGSRWNLSRDGKSISAQDKAEMGLTILKHMGLLNGPIAPTVLLVGHGSGVRNNPQAAGLACGACGGQSGAVNVRILSEVLNDSEVRRIMVENGVELSEQTLFIPALHDTATDDIELLGIQPIDAELSDWLKRASHLTRLERAPKLDLGGLEGEELDRRLRQQARDSLQVRPEWGLANNAAFVVAPRSRTANVNLKGRSFLHDYQWQNDQEFKTLELILTGPMVVTHWINMQYNASVSDPQRYGSGNKLLHNVVGGNLGVFEGNGGDLRTGLAMQSVHNGRQWMHQLLRLSVVIAAPRQAIDEVYHKHEVVRDLVDHGWIHLFRLDDDHRIVERFCAGEWKTEEQTSLS